MNQRLLALKFACIICVSGTRMKQMPLANADENGFSKPSKNYTFDLFNVVEDLNFDNVYYTKYYKKSEYR